MIRQETKVTKHKNEKAKSIWIHRAGFHFSHFCIRKGFVASVNGIGMHIVHIASHLWYKIPSTRSMNGKLVYYLYALYRKNTIPIKQSL